MAVSALKTNLDGIVTLLPFLFIAFIFFIYIIVQLRDVDTSKSWYEILVPNPGIKVRG